jgi:hypothetical protein
MIEDGTDDAPVDRLGFSLRVDHRNQVVDCCRDNPAEARFCRHCGKRIVETFTRSKVITVAEGTPLSAMGMPRPGDPHPTDPSARVVKSDASHAGPRRIHPWWAFWRRARHYALRVTTTYERGTTSLGPS